MTQFLFDVSRHQAERSNPPDLGRALLAGFGIVNIQLDRGRQEDVLPPWAPVYAARARALGMGISTYRWLDNRLGGAVSARRAYDRMAILGGPAGMAHIVDCEDTATEQTVRDYVVTMTQLLGRPIALYTGDWWWTAPGRNWPMAGLTPYLHAAPNSGYPGSYPGDTSSHWSAGYGGWPQLSIMQYAVRPLPGEVDDCSLSAIRDPAVWTALTGGTDVGAYQDWVSAGKPVSGIVRPVARIGQRLRAYGYTVYNIGDQSHLTHLPPEDHTPFSGTGWPIASPRWWIHAMDIMPPAASKGLPSLQQLGAQMIADARAGHPGMRWLKYQNWEPERDNGGACYQDRFMPTFERRTSGDRGHIHSSARSDMVAYAGADDYDPVARVRGQMTPPTGTGSRDTMFIAQFKNADGSINLAQWVGDGVTHRGVHWFDSVGVLNPHVVRVGPFATKAAMLDVIGPVDAAGAAGPQVPALLAAIAALAAQITELADRPPVELSDEQLAELAAALSAADELSEADRAAILALVTQGAKAALREGGGPSPASNVE